MQQAYMGSATLN